VRAGPKGVVLVAKPKLAAKAAKRLAGIAPEVSVDGGRIIVASPSEDEITRRALIERLLSALAGGE
ncbi:MAG TPA: hypothetical protein VNZ85_19935, partial [Caulobacter sp.]|nr:hypothetical protein [Caulobacter sp.]